MSSSKKRPKLSPIRRIIVLIVGGIALGAAVITMARVVPRPVDIVIRVADTVPNDRPSRTLLTVGDEAVIDAEAGSAALQDSRLRYHFWLAPEEHRLEFQVRGCAPMVRTFDPRETDIVAAEYRCRREP